VTNNEKKLQAQMVMKFSQRYPYHRGRLFAVNNEASNNRHAMSLKALGVHKGVSDLIWCDGILVGIEIKAPGEKHSRSHIESQYNWGLTITNAGGNYYIVTNLASFFSVIAGRPDSQVYTLERIAELMEQSKSTIIFS